VPAQHAQEGRGNVSEADAVPAGTVRRIDDDFAIRIFLVFAVLAAIAVAISLGGKWVGKAIALAGHTEDTTLREVVIGNNVLQVPSNAIRFESDRRDGIASSLRLYLRWPGLTGYSVETRNDFNHLSPQRNILFLSFEQRMMSRDMSGRYEPIYSALIEHPGSAGPAGLSVHRFTPSSGYLNEMLVVGEAGDGSVFVARCLTGESAAESLAECERDVLVGDDLSLIYRFPGSLLPDWRRLDAGIAAYVSSVLRTGR